MPMACHEDDPCLATLLMQTAAGKLEMGWGTAADAGRGTRWGTVLRMAIFLLVFFSLVLMNCVYLDFT